MEVVEKSQVQKRGEHRVARMLVAALMALMLSLGTLSAPAGAAAIGDNYPSKYKSKAVNGVVDEWNFYNRNCTSFVAWRLNSANGVKFTNQYKGASRWGNAKTWGTVAKSLKVPVNSTPAVGSVAWSDKGTYGHVAWVAEVRSGGQIVVEEYNWGVVGGYGKRTVAASSFTGFIHIKDLATTKPLTAAPAPTAKASIASPGKLTATIGTWKPAPVTLRYQWQRNGANISGATGTAYSLTGSDYGKKVRLRVTGSKSGYTTKNVYSREFFAAKVTTKNSTAYVNVRSTASTSGAKRGSISAGKMVALECYSHGTAVTGPYGRSTIWYRIAGGGWVTDALLETNTNSTVTPRC